MFSNERKREPFELLNEFWSQQVLDYKKRKPFQVGNCFYTSNDYVSIPEILSLKSSSNTADSKIHDNIVNIFVGESDYLSAIHAIEGHIIIVDIDPDLLRFLEWQYAFFLQHAHEPFQQVRELYIAECNKWQRDVYNANEFTTERIENLGNLHFLDNAENFQKAMQALKFKKVTFLNVNLFEPKEQELLCNAIRYAGLKVRIFNATNLPDYDDGELIKLFFNLPWTEKLPNLIIWNVHNRGPYVRFVNEELNPKNKELNTHYLFLASTPQEYKEIFQQKIPTLLGKVDSVFLETNRSSLKEKEMVRYEGHEPMRSNYLRALYTERRLLPALYQECRLAVYPRDSTGRLFNSQNSKQKLFDDICANKKSSSDPREQDEAKIYAQYKARLSTTFVCIPDADLKTNFDKRLQEFKDCNIETCDDLSKIMKKFAPDMEFVPEAFVPDKTMQSHAVSVINKRLDQVKKTDKSHFNLQDEIRIIIQFATFFKIKDMVFKDLVDFTSKNYSKNLLPVLLNDNDYASMVNVTVFLLKYNLLNSHAIYYIKNVAKQIGELILCSPDKNFDKLSATECYFKLANMLGIATEQQIKVANNLLNSADLYLISDEDLQNDRIISSISHLLDNEKLFEKMINKFLIYPISDDPVENYLKVNRFIDFVRVRLPKKSFNLEQESIIKKLEQCHSPPSKEVYAENESASSDDGFEQTDDNSEQVQTEINGQSSKTGLFGLTPQKRAAQIPAIPQQNLAPQNHNRGTVNLGSKNS